MSAWLHEIWNDPMRENPWALGMLVSICLATFGAFGLVYCIRDNRRRKQETMNDPSSTEPIGGWTASADDIQAADRAAAERVIAAARAEGSPPEPRESAGLHDVVNTEQDGERVSLLTVPRGEAPGEPRTVAEWGQELPVNDADLKPGGPGRIPSEESQRLERLMNTDPRLVADPLGAPLASRQDEIRGQVAEQFREDRVTDRRTIAALLKPARETAPQPGRNILAGAPVAVPPVSPVREICKHCEGTGYVPSISDHLRESIALVATSGDEIVKAFYGELLSLAPDLASLFPADLLTTDQTHGQRDRLLKALVALSELYDPADAERMDRLDTALRSFGRSHAAFARADGTVKGATWEEYGAVKTVLFRTLVAAAGASWRPEYTESWSQAYDYAAAVMLAEQYRSGFAAPRFPRS